MKSNVKISIQAGLQKDYGIFNLNAASAYTNILIETITTGKTYVESGETSIMHAGESGYREFEGINPVNAIDWDLTILGDKLKTKLKLFFDSEKDNLENTAQPEIYDDINSYKNYKNQFLVEFGAITQDTSTVGQYYDYHNDVVDIIPHGSQSQEGQEGSENTAVDKSITYALDLINGSDENRYIKLGIKLLHYSKYYNVYATDNSITAPILRPLLYYETDLDPYGLGVNGTMPYLKHIWVLNFYYGGAGARDEDLYVSQNVSLYDTTKSAYMCNNPAYRCGQDFGGNKHISMYMTNIGNYNTWRTNDTDWWENEFPRGFMLFGVNDESSTTETFNRNDDCSTSQSDHKYYESYTSIFAPYSNTYNFDGKQVTGNGRAGSTPMVAIAYNGDTAGNTHIFNTWFPVSFYGQPGNSQPTQQIKYKSSAVGKYPSTTGLVVASLLTSIYIYTESVGDSVTYIPDVIYLADHYVTYTKDIIYKAYVSSSLTQNHNSLLLIHKFPYEDYIKAIKDKVNAIINSNTNETYTSSDKNINAEIKACIKNVPLQFRFGYIQPDMDMVGVKAGKAKVVNIDGTSSDVILNSNSKEELYQILTENGIPVATPLGSTFRIRYLKSLKIEEGNMLKGEYDDNIALEKNEWAWKTFKLDNELLSLKRSDYTSSGSSYSIVTDFHDDAAFHHLPKNEKIAPFALLF